MSGPERCVNPACPDYGHIQDGPCRIPAPPQDSNPPLTPLDLAALPEGKVVYDATGDQWTKVDGLWVCRDAKMSSESLTHVWGPITKEEQ